MEADIKKNNGRHKGCKAISSKRQHQSILSCKTSNSRYDLCVGYDCYYKNNDLCHKMEETKTTEDLEKEGLKDI